MKKTTSLKSIPLFRPTISKKDLMSVLNCLVDEHLSDQNLTGEFEKKFNQFIRAKNNVVALNAASSGFYLIFKLLGLQPGDEVILSPLAESFVLEVIKLFQLKPVWIDLEMGSLQMNSDQIIAKINQHTRVVIITHHFGYPFRVNRLLHSAEWKGRNIKLIEDNTSVIGSKIKVKIDSEIREEIVGLDGDYGVFCFNSRRMLTTGQGGMVVSKLKKETKLIKAMRSPQEKLVVGEELPPLDDRLHLTMNDLNAALGLSEISLLEKFIRRRQEIRKYFSDVVLKSRHSFFAEDDTLVLNGYSFPMIFSSGIATAKEVFNQSKIEVAGLEQGTIYEHLPYHEDFKVINELKLKFLQIPIYPTLKIKEIERITQAIASVL